MRFAPADPGTLKELAPTTPPARRVEGEIRAPATLVDATFHATADAGSIPAVSTDPIALKPCDPVQNGRLGCRCTASALMRSAGREPAP